MKKIRKLASILTVAALAAFLLFAYHFDWLHRAGHSEADHAGELTAQSAEAPATRYTCSMHPFIIRDEPGNCPICGMTLTPVKENDGAATSEILIDPATSQNMGLRTAPVERRDLTRTIRTVGLVGYEEPRQYSINSKIEGWIERLHVNQTGQPVKKGSPLLEIYSPELAAAQQEYLLALENNRRLAGSPFPEIASGSVRLLEATRTRLKWWDITDAQIAKLEANGVIRKTMTLYSPYTGVVTMKKVVEGMRIMAGEELLQISDLSRVWVNADIYEYDLPLVREGQGAVVEVPSLPGRQFNGKITYVYPYLENESRTVKARIEFANPDLALKPEMFTNVVIAIAPRLGVLAIPGNAVLRSGKGATVFVSLGEGRFEPRSVETGISDDHDFLEITSGLQEGEAVVTSAQFLLDSESRLQEAFHKMTAPEAGDENAAKEKLEDLFK